MLFCAVQVDTMLFGYIFVSCVYWMFLSSVHNVLMDPVDYVVCCVHWALKVLANFFFFSGFTKYADDNVILCAGVSVCVSVYGICTLSLSERLKYCLYLLH